MAQQSVSNLPPQHDLIRLESLLPGARRLVLCRPERRNALSIALLEQLCNTIEALQSDPAERVVVLCGEGPVFSAGLDLHEAANNDLVEQSSANVARILQLLRETALVTIAAVHGGAYAGGAGVMAACDIVISTDDAKISFPEARRGLLPALICEVMRRKVRDGDLRDLFLAGEPITAQRAQQIGLIQHVVPPDQLTSRIEQLTRAVLAGGPNTIRETKRLLSELTYGSTNANRDSLELWHLQARHGAEAREGLAAFAEKRPPNWTPVES